MWGKYTKKSKKIPFSAESSKKVWWVVLFHNAAGGNGKRARADMAGNTQGKRVAVTDRHAWELSFDFFKEAFGFRGIVGVRDGKPDLAAFYKGGKASSQIVFHCVFHRFFGFGNALSQRKSIQLRALNL